VAHVVFFIVLILLESVVVLVDGVVGEVHVKIVHVILARRLVLFCSEPCEGLLVDVDSQRVHSTKQSVYSQVVLEVVNQVGFVHVLLDHCPLLLPCCLQDHVVVPAQEDAFALRLCFGLDDEGLDFLTGARPDFGVELLAEVYSFTGQQPGLGEEIVLSWEGSLHPTEVARQVVFASYYVHPRKVVDLLV